MYASYASPRERTASAVAAFAVVAVVAAAMVFGLRAGSVARGTQALVAVFVDTAKRPEVPPPQRKRIAASRRAAKGNPSPRNLHDKATQVVAPPPRVALLPPPPVRVAVQAGSGAATANGASDLAGPGQGAGGVGDGLGGGGDGGDGGGGGRAAIGPRQIRGRLSFKDLPQDVLAPGREASVGVRYWVEVDGRVRGCRADEPSDYPGVDALTCRLIEQRFVFRPARDRVGHPVRAAIVERHTWFMKERAAGD